MLIDSLEKCFIRFSGFGLRTTTTMTKTATPAATTAILNNCVESVETKPQETY